MWIDSTSNSFGTICLGDWYDVRVDSAKLEFSRKQNSCATRAPALARSKQLGPGSWDLPYPLQLQCDTDLKLDFHWKNTEVFIIILSSSKKFCCKNFLYIRNRVYCYFYRLSELTYNLIDGLSSVSALQCRSMNMIEDRGHSSKLIRSADNNNQEETCKLS